MRNTLSPAGLQSRYKAAAALAKTSANTIPDGDGLMLVVRGSGASWVLRARIRGQRKDITIGRRPTLGFNGARQVAELARKNAACGVDVTAEKRAERHEAKADAAAKADSVRQLYEDWMSLRGDAISDVYRGNIEAGFLKDILPAIGSKPSHEVTRADCVALLRTVEGRGATVMLRRLRMWLRQMFEFGIDDELRPLLASLVVPTGHLTSFKRDKKEISRGSPTLLAHSNWSSRSGDSTSTSIERHFCSRPIPSKGPPRSGTRSGRNLIWTRGSARSRRIACGSSPSTGSRWLCTCSVLSVRYWGVVGDRGLLFPGRKPGQSISKGTLTSRLNSMGYKGLHTPHGFPAVARTIIVERLRIDKVYAEKQLSHGTEDSGMRGSYD